MNIKAAAVTKNDIRFVKNMYFPFIVLVRAAWKDIL